MAACKKIRRKEKDVNNGIVSKNRSINSYYGKNPSWRFLNCDKEAWAFSKEHIGDNIWDELLPYFQSLENQTWGDILIKDKKKNHSLQINTLNKDVQKRLETLYIEAESLISLRISGTHRLYGYITEAVFNILWYDDKHGDNKDCVCRSVIKHT